MSEDLFIKRSTLEGIAQQYRDLTETDEKIKVSEMAEKMKVVHRVGHDKGYEEGHNDGYNNGYDNGYGIGEGHGHDRGYDEGYYYGHIDGYEEGYADGVTGSAITFQTDDSIAYSKTVPNNAEPKAMLLSVGGMTKKCSNLVYIPDIEANTTGHDGNTISVYLTDTIFVSAETLATVSSSIWRLKFDYADGTSIYIADSVFESGGGRIKASADNPIVSITYRATYITEGKYSGFMVSYNTTRVPYEPYYEGLRDSKVTEIISRDGEGNEITRRPIPEEVQALEGYGEGVAARQSIIDFNSKTFIPNCKRIIFTGNENWVLASNNDSAAACYYVGISGLKPLETARSHQTNSHFEYGSRGNEKFGVTSIHAGGGVRFYTVYQFPTLGEWVAYVKSQYENGTPITSVISIANPNVVDISTYLTDFDNILNVERGGSLEFVNEYGQAVPSSILYTVKVGT